MLQRDLILEQPHVVMVALEAMNHHEEVHAHESAVHRCRQRVIIHLLYLCLADLVCTLDTIDEHWIRIHAVALFEDDGAHLCQRLLKALGLDAQLRGRRIKLAVFMASSIPQLLHALFNVLAFDPRQVLMCFADVLVCVGRQQGEVASGDHLTEDRLGPLLARLVLILDLQVLGDEARGRLHDLNDLVLKDQQLASNEIDFE